jgi:universal stress protein A
MTPPRNLLVPTDFSRPSNHAVEYAVELAARLDATIHLLHAVHFPPLGVPELGLAYAATMTETMVKDAQRTLDEIADRHRGKVKMAPVRIEVGDPRDVVEKVANAIHADMIIIGTHGRRGLRRFLLGSVAEAVLRAAPCPVLSVREPG